MAAGQGDPARNTTFTRELKPWDYPNKRVGGPKRKWASEAPKLYWNDIRHNLGPEFRESDFNPERQEHRDIIERDV